MNCYYCRAICSFAQKLGVMLLPYYDIAAMEAGCDEAGRGCLAGAVTAAAVILPKDFWHPDLNDSKQISEKKREALRPIIEREAIAFAVAFVSAAEIDEINILQASFLAMHRALAQLHTQPQLILVDGNRFKPYGQIPHHCIIKGDAKYMAIAAASILAKTYRDDYMTKLHEEFSQYAWLQNKGYPTLQHRRAIAQYGISPHHRKSFTLLLSDNQADKT
jgi:ribonuclease HII